MAPVTNTMHFNPRMEVLSKTKLTFQAKEHFSMEMPVGLVMGKKTTLVEWGVTLSVTCNNRD